MRQPDTLSRTRYERVLRERRERFLAAVGTEVKRAMEMHRRMNSGHEAYAVILEELEEFWQEVKAQKPREPLSRNAYKELLQTAAMCCRAVLDLELDPDPDATPVPPGRAR